MLGNAWASKGGVQRKTCEKQTVHGRLAQCLLWLTFVVATQLHPLGVDLRLRVRMAASLREVRTSSVGASSEEAVRRVQLVASGSQQRSRPLAWGDGKKWGQQGCMEDDSAGQVVDVQS
eukprot:6214122-Pleurochrysis_carterae.AAC.4